MTLPKLTIGADGFALPAEVVTLATAICAQRGAGKSYLASVMAEEMLKTGQPVGVVDPTGAWWGLKSSASGKAPGYQVAVFGGQHADVPLEPDAGEVVARAFVEQRFSAVFDTSDMRKNERKRFMAAFLETLYRLNRQALHLFIDEADDVAPQKSFGPEDARVLGACEDLVRRGRRKGIGCTLITQRPQSVNKDVLTQCEVLIALRLGHPLDIKAIRSWVEVHADLQQADAMMKSLPDLPRGTAWFWSPALGIFTKAAVRKRETFDSGATPKPGETLKGPTASTAIDVVKLGAEIAATVQRARENDPKALRLELDALRRELAMFKARDAAPPEVRVQRIELPVFGDADVKVLNDLRAALGKMTDSVYALEREAAKRVSLDSIPMTDAERAKREQEIALSQELGALGCFGTDQECKELIAASAKAIQAEVDLEIVETMKTHRLYPGVVVNNGFGPGKATAQRVLLNANATADLPKGERALLTAIAQHGEASRELLTIVTGYKRSSRDAYLQRLFAKGYVGEMRDGSGMLSATDKGLKALGAFAPLPTGAALLKHWLAKLPRGESAILEVLARKLKPVSRDELTAATGYKRSSRDAYLQRLMTRKLVYPALGGLVQMAEQLR